MKLPICREMDSQGKATVKHIKQYYPMRCLLDGGKGRYAEKACQRRIDRNGNDNCRLCCCLLKIKFEEFKKTSYISSQNLFKVSKRDGFQDGTLSEICLIICLKVRHYLIVCAMPVLGKLETLLNFTISSTRACRKRRRSRFLAIQADASVFCQLPFRRHMEVLKQEKDIRHLEKTQHQRNRRNLVSYLHQAPLRITSL